MDSIVYARFRILYSILFVWVWALPTHAVTDLIVDTKKVLHRDFLGLSAVYHGFSYMPESMRNGISPEFRKIEFDRVRQTSFKIARTWYGSDWAMPDWGGNFEWNSVKMNAFYQWLQAMKDRNITVAIQAGWWFPEHVASSISPDKSHFHIARDPQDIDIFTHWVSQSLHELIEVRGYTNIRYLFLFTEPGEWCEGNSICGKLPPGYRQFAFYTKIAKALQSKLIQDERRQLVRIVGPNSIPVGSWLQTAKERLNDVIDIYSSHEYDKSGYKDWFSVVKRAVDITNGTRKPFWLDEYGHSDMDLRNGPKYGTWIAEANAAAMNAGAQTTILWLYQDQYYVWPLDKKTNNDFFFQGLHQWGTQPWIPENRTVRPAWYLFGLLSKYLGGGSSDVLNTTGIRNGVVISAVRSHDGSISLLVVNSKETVEEVKILFTEPLHRTFRRFLYDPYRVPTNGLPIQADKHYDSVGSTLSESLPPLSVAIYTTIVDY